jgi:hypothetical protein
MDAPAPLRLTVLRRRPKSKAPDAMADLGGIIEIRTMFDGQRYAKLSERRWKENQIPIAVAGPLICYTSRHATPE